MDVKTFMWTVIVMAVLGIWAVLSRLDKIIDELRQIKDETKEINEVAEQFRPSKGEDF